MGWSLSGSARVVLDVALRKARVLQLDEGDYYKLITTITAEGTNSWSSCSSKLLYSWGAAEWTHHLANHQVYGCYKEYVKSRLAEACKPKWAAMAAAHKAEIPYLSIQDGPSSALAQIRTLPFPWRIQISIRSWCRARAGYIAYRHRDGHYSRAKLQACISCNRIVSHGCLHTFGHCPAWSEPRRAFLNAAGLQNLTDQWTITKAILSCAPTAAGYEIAAVMADEIDLSATRFWARST